MCVHSFVVADKSGNGTGFTATWTEVSETSGPCPGFQCENSSYCISNQLRCNSVMNCGYDDVSDETNCEYILLTLLLLSSLFYYNNVVFFVVVMYVGG